MMTGLPDASLGKLWRGVGGGCTYRIVGVLVCSRSKVKPIHPDQKPRENGRLALFVSSQLPVSNCPAKHD